MAAKPRIAKQADIHGEALNSPRQFFGVFKYSKRALELVWTTSRPARRSCWASDRHRRRPALGRRLGRRAHRRQRGRGDRARMPPAPTSTSCPVLRWVLAEALILGGHHRGAPRHHVVHSRCSRPSSRIA